MRLDKYMSRKFPQFSRNQVQNLIKNGEVLVNGKRTLKPSFQILLEIEIEILKDTVFVGRGGDKIFPFLKKLEISGNALDIGASTGGFTEALLLNGISTVTALDVGTLQLHKSLRENPKVISVENMDIRDFKSEIEFDVITCDVSFISIHKILRSIDRLAKRDIVILFKPQFEVGESVKRDKNGVVVDELAISKYEEKFLNRCQNEFSWRYVFSETSELAGKKGNLEKFFYFKKDGGE